MHPHAELIQKFYTAFNRYDAETMVLCYAKEITFSDPVFGNLHGEEAAGMWRMLCARAKNLTIACTDIHADDYHGSARWEARYTFSKTGRKVHNIIHASFEFRNGQIVRHDDVFDLWRWTRMALGPTGVLLGWTPLIQSRVRKEALNGLKAFLSKQKTTA